jgi:hypothetical protein
LLLQARHCCFRCIRSAHLVRRWGQPRLHSMVSAMGLNSLRCRSPRARAISHTSARISMSSAAAWPTRGNALNFDQPSRGNRVVFCTGRTTTGIVTKVVTENCTDGQDPVPFAANNSSVGGAPILMVTFNGSKLTGSGPDLLVVYYFNFTNFTFSAYAAESALGLLPLNSGTFTLAGAGAP